MCCTEPRALRALFSTQQTTPYTHMTHISPDNIVTTTHAPMHASRAPMSTELSEHIVAAICLKVDYEQQVLATLRCCAAHNIPVTARRTNASSPETTYLSGVPIMDGRFAFRLPSHPNTIIFQSDVIRIGGTDETGVQLTLSF